MSFRELVNGQPSDLHLPQDVPTVKPVIGGVAGAAAVSLATAAAAYLIPGGIGGGNVGRAASSAYGQLKRGSQAREEALAINEHNKVVRRELGLRFLDRAQLRGGNAADLLLRKAKMFYAMDRVDDAIEAVLAAATVEPSHLGALKWCAYLYLHTAQYEQAIAMLETAKPLNPTSIEILEYLAVGYDRVGKLDQANKCWEEISSLVPNAVKPWVEQARYHASRGNYGVASDKYQIARKLDKSVEVPWEIESTLGYTAFVSGKIEEAEKRYARALEWDAAYLPALLGRCRCAIGKADFMLASVYVNLAIQSNENNCEAHLLAGEVYKKLNDTDAAMKHWLKAFQLDQTSAVPWVNEVHAAKKCFLDGKLEASTEHLMHAKKLNPDWDEVDQRLGEVNARITALALVSKGDEYAAKGDFQAAEVAWKQSLEHVELAETLLKIGAECADRGNTTEALTYFERASKLGHPLAESALRLCRSYHDFSPETGPS